MYCIEVFTCLLAFFLMVTRACETPFHPVGSHCLLIDNRMLGTWSEMREICQAFGGDLVNMQDANILNDISNYIQNHDLTDISYWVGASYNSSDGIWTWSSDSTPVRMGPPLWGRLYDNEPNENCAIITKFEFYYMDDEDCNLQYHGVICQQASIESGSVINSPINKQPKACPPQYDAVWGTCLLVDSKDIAPDKAVSFCESNDGHLVKIDDANFLGAVCDYLNDQGSFIHFWIDGSDSSTEDIWLFSDGTSVKRGTPYWRVYSEDSQDPISSIDSHHIALYSECLFYAPDDAVRHGVICQFDI